MGAKEPLATIDGKRGRPLEALKLVDVYSVEGSRAKHYLLTKLGEDLLKYVPVMPKRMVSRPEVSSRKKSKAAPAPKPA